MTEYKGTIKWFNGQKGYGFIQPETGGKDVFVHITAVNAAGFAPEDMKERRQIAYTLTEREGKTTADRLRLID